MKIGYGYDVHRLIPGRKLVLGGVEIPYKKGLWGHSDADVLIHAIIDAILGALAWGDIGTWFPDYDEAYKDVDSRFLLKKVMAKFHETGWKISNLDCTICAQQPKLAPFILQMRENLAADLETAIENISVKATTEEGMGISGSEEGMTASAVILLIPKDA
jgi:2-C-methyl-D-erythritol 2,4-cyclodiphosphate synthase